MVVGPYRVLPFSPALSKGVEDDDDTDVEVGARGGGSFKASLNAFCELGFGHGKV